METMRQNEREEPGGLRSADAPTVVTSHLSTGHAVRHIRDIGREISRSLDADAGVQSPASARRAASDSRETQARKRANQLRELYTHLAIYGIVICFLLILDLITGPGLWFFWPALAWGVGVAIHAFTVVGQEGFFGKQWEDRKVGEWLGHETTPDRAAAPVAPPAAKGEMNELVERGIGEVADLRRIAMGVGNSMARGQALRICVTADNILTALAEEGRETRLAREFLDRYLGPARTILSQYARLSSRGVAAAQPALERVESHDLPLIERRMDELFDRIHRGDVIDLQVASEMLELGLIENRTTGDPSKQ